MENEFEQPEQETIQDQQEDAAPVDTAALETIFADMSTAELEASLEIIKKRLGESDEINFQELDT